MKKYANIVFVLFFFGTLFANESIMINEPSLYPEGISYDMKSEHFFVSSVSKGEIWSINKKGKSSLFAHTKHPSTIGLLVNPKHNQLLVCIADPGVGDTSTQETKNKLAKLIIYDITTKIKLHEYDLGAVSTADQHMANDLTYDDRGNIYVTDSLSPHIYKIDTQGTISILTTNTTWNSEKGKLGLNGIVYHPNGYLLVAHYSNKSLYKISIDTPQVHHKINLSTNNLSSCQKLGDIDGLRLINKENLALVSNTFSKKEDGSAVYKLHSSNNWEDASFTGIMQSEANFPTTLTIIDETLYVLHAHLATLFSGNSNPVQSFEIEPVVFKEIKNVKK